MLPKKGSAMVTNLKCIAAPLGELVMSVDDLPEREVLSISYVVGAAWERAAANSSVGAAAISYGS